MVDGKVGGLGVVVTPRRKVIVSLAGAAVHLDLHATHRLHTKIFDRFKNICAAMCHYDRCQKIGGRPMSIWMAYGTNQPTKGFLLITDCKQP